MQKHSISTYTIKIYVSKLDWGVVLFKKLRNKMDYLKNMYGNSTFVVGCELLIHYLSWPRKIHKQRNKDSALIEVASAKRFLCTRLRTEN